MKKLLVMVIAMALVFGMSAGVMAVKGPLPLEADPLDIDIDVDELGILDIENVGTLSMTIENFMDAEDTDSPYDSESFGIYVANNTPVDLMVEQSYEFEDIFGDMLKGRVFWGESQNDKWIISPNVINETKNTNIEGRVDKSVIFDSFDSGERTIDARMNVQLNDTVEWYEFEADDTLEGTLTFTVVAQ